MPQLSSMNNKLIARNTAFLYFRMLFNMIVTLYTSRVVLAMLGDIDFGVYGVVAGFVSMFGFLNTSMTNAIQRYYNFEWGKNGIMSLSRVYSHALLIQIVLSIILIIALESFGVWYINSIMVIPPERLSTANWVFQFSVISMAFIVLNVPYSAAIMAYERMDFYAIIGVVEVCIKLFLAIILQFVNVDKLLFWAVLTPLTSIFSFLCYYIYTKKYLKVVKFKKVFDKPLFYGMLNFAGWNLFGTMSGVMKEQGLNLVLNYFFGPIVNAARAVSSQVTGAAMSFTSNVSLAIRPQLTKSYAEGDLDKVIRYMFTISKINYLSFFIFALPLCLEMKVVLSVWLGKYPEHSESFTILVFLTCAVNLLNAPVSMIVHASGRMKKYQVIGSCINILAIPVAFIMHNMFDVPPEISFVILALFTAFCQIASLIILRQIVSIFSLRSYSREVIGSICLVSILATFLPAIVRVTMEEGIMRLLLVTILSMGTVCISSYYFALNNIEKNMVNSIINKILHRY